jgi:hypothetical protein
MVDLLDDDSEDEDDRWELDDPTDPEHPDFDLSEAAGYTDWDSKRRPVLPRALMVAIAIILIAAMLWPACAQIFR